MAYGQTPWTQQHLPLSSYSTLNGATTSNSQPQQRQDSPPMQSMMIDPSLTINTTASSNGSHLYSHNGVDQASQQSHYQTLFAHSPPQPPQTLSINPMFVNALAHQQLQQQHQQQQTTLSPTVLHSPTASTSSSMYYPTSAAPVQTNLTASSSSSGRSSAPVESLSQKRQRLQTRLRGLPNLTGGGAVKAIVGAIDDCEAADVDPSTRLEIITRIRDKSPAHFFRAWCENPDAMDITREWLKDGATRRDNGAFEETIMPLLQVIARLPFTVEQMLTYKMGKIIVKLTKWPNAGKYIISCCFPPLRCWKRNDRSKAKVLFIMRQGRKYLTRIPFRMNTILPCHCLNQLCTNVDSNMYLTTCFLFSLYMSTRSDQRHGRRHRARMETANCGRSRWPVKKIRRK